MRVWWRGNKFCSAETQYKIVFPAICIRSLKKIWNCQTLSVEKYEIVRLCALNRINEPFNVLEWWRINKSSFNIFFSFLSEKCTCLDQEKRNRRYKCISTPSDGLINSGLTAFIRTFQTLSWMLQIFFAFQFIFSLNLSKRLFLCGKRIYFSPQLRTDIMLAFAATLKFQTQLKLTVIDEFYFIFCFESSNMFLSNSTIHWRLI